MAARQHRAIRALTCSSRTSSRLECWLFCIESCPSPKGQGPCTHFLGVDSKATLLPSPPRHKHSLDPLGSFGLQEGSRETWWQARICSQGHSQDAGACQWEGL